MAKSTTFRGTPKPYGATGHFDEPRRHSLQARGIKTGHLAKKVHPLDFGTHKPKPKVVKPLIEWMDDWDDEIKYRLENWQDFGYEEKPTEEQVQNDVWGDADYQEMIWDDKMGYLTEEMQKINPHDIWTARVENFGWRSLSGVKEPFRAEDGEELLSKILPKTDNHFRIFKTRTGFKIQNYHHDSPMGNEWYYVDRATKQEREGRVE